MPVEPGIVFDAVWKKFQRGERHDSLRDLIPAAVRRFTRSGPASDELGENDFWVVSDVSFAVRPGECLGIIGGNGAGKSTTLKLLTGILRPTRGDITVIGRVGSLIEVSAGFHPDLTGRENVFLQGAIMGMGAANIRKRFDEIVAFAGVEEFIDMAVKRYSSGMNARLGFAIAAHLDPDVLIIDEVLAVGDHTFQQRAFTRLQQLTRSGMPVVIVSHQLDRVLQMCTSALLLKRGQVMGVGHPRDVIAQYFTGNTAGNDGEALKADAPYEIMEASISAPTIGSGEFLDVTITCRRREEHPLQGNESVGVALVSLAGATTVAALGTGSIPLPLPTHGVFRLDLRLQANVAPGPYSLDTWVWSTHDPTFRGPRLSLEVMPTILFDGAVQLNPTMSLTPIAPESFGANVRPRSDLAQKAS
ncbi:MAG: ABC transporter ATP-binding protein [Gemmatimonadaceae bacterium]|nr:ABC transporter ATP-binding protein [Gemmatimonadaceae bacterium]